MADSAIAIDLTLKNEGGFQVLSNDPGNWTGGSVGKGELKGTKYGISAREFPNLDIENLTVTQAETIYVTKYWNLLYFQILNQGVANKIFDMGVNQGPDTAVKLLQQVLGIEADGDFGPQTLAAVNAADATSTLAAYKVRLVAHVVQIGAQNPGERPFVADWIRRINS